MDKTKQLLFGWTKMHGTLHSHNYSSYARFPPILVYFIRSVPFVIIKFVHDDSKLRQSIRKTKIFLDENFVVNKWNSSLAILWLF